MKVKDIADKIIDGIYDVWDGDYTLYTNDPSCECLGLTEKDYDSCKNRDVDYVTIENHIEYTKNNGIICCPIIIIRVI